MEIGSFRIHFDKLTSTNDFAIKLLKKMQPPDGTIIDTQHQTRGRGQLNATWVADPIKNITLSTIIYPHFLPLDEIYYLNKAICVGVALCIEEFVGGRVSIKWPNDIYVEKAKIAGILIQNSIMGKSLLHSVLGIGINVNQTTFPQTFSACSLKTVLKKDIACNDVLLKLVEYLQTVYNEMDLQSYQLIDRWYHQRLLGLNQELSFKEIDTDTNLNGRIIMVDKLGKIHINVMGDARIYAAKEIEFNL